MTASSLTETGMAQTGMAQTGVRETGVKETGVKETRMTEIGMSDAAMPEAGMPETSPPGPGRDPGPGGTGQAGSGAELRVLQGKDPYSACGRTVAYLMGIPNFARLPFGQLARLIAGQINRGQYFFVVDPAGAMVGYCGWAQTSRAAAEDWFERNIDLGARIAATGPACVINLWQASSPAANARIIAALRRRLAPGTEIILAKRFYPDGSVRGVRLPVAPAQLRPAKPDAKTGAKTGAD